MLAKLRSDHSKIKPLLLVLSSDMRRMHSGQKVDIYVIRDLVDYLRCYIDERHHPLENILYDFYLEKLGDQRLKHQLEPEHDTMEQSADELLNALNSVISGHVVERAMVLAKLDSYVRLQWKLIEQEEQVIFPKIEQYLTEDDWFEVDKRVVQAGLSYDKTHNTELNGLGDFSQYRLI